MQSRTRYVDGTRFETRIGAHYIVCDQPLSEGGMDAGASAPELLLAALGSCAGHYALEYLRGRALPVAGLTVEVSAEKFAESGRLGAFRVKVYAGQAGEKDLRGLLRAVRACLVFNTLASIPSIEVEVAEPIARNDSGESHLCASAH